MSAARLLAANLPASVCVAAAAALAYGDREGWGWFLLVALMFGGVTAISPGSDPDATGEGL